MTSSPNCSNALRFRTAASTDIEKLTALINAAFIVERPIFGGDRINAQEVRERLRTGQFILAEDEGGLAGCFYVELRGERAYLGLLSVDSSRQRSGIGSKLVAAAEDHCRSVGCRFLDLRIVSARQGLPEFYGRLGYSQTGTSRLPADVKPKVPCHFIHMSKPLVSVKSQRVPS